MSLKQTKCPNCGDTIKINQLSQIYDCKVECPSCHSSFILESKHSKIGAENEAYMDRVIFDDERNERIRIKERDEDFKLKLLDIIQQNINQLIGFGMLIGLFLFGIGMLGSLDDGVKTIYLSQSAKSFKGENYNLVVDQLQDMGFENIEVEELKDLKIGWLIKDGEVEKVMIDGVDDFKKEDRFKADSKVKIYYHTFKDKE